MTSLPERITESILSVPVRTKIIGIMLLPVLILGFALNYWIQTGLADWLSYLLSDERVAMAMEAGSRSVLLVTGLAAVISILLTLVLMLLLTRPLLELRQVAQTVMAGNLAARARIWANDEIGAVARLVNLMLDQLIAKQQALVYTNRQLEALHRVSTAASHDLGLHELLDASLQTTLDVMGLGTGWVYLRELSDPSAGSFRLAAIQGLNPALARVLDDTAASACQCQRDLLDGKARVVCLNTCQRELGLSRFQRAPLAHLSVPLEARGQRFGIMNLLCEPATTPTADDLALLSTMGAHISEFLANAWLHTSLVEKEAARQALLKALVRAQEDERARLARELHDGAGQQLTGLLIRLTALQKQMARGHAADRIAELCAEVSDTIRNVRELSFRLRPAALEEFGLEVALQSLVKEVIGDAGLTYACQLEAGVQRLPFEVETALYRIAQESLTNIIRHAGAHHVNLELLTLPYAVCLRIEDDGRGFDATTISDTTGSQRLGLMGMHERAEMLGGSLVVRSAPGAGTAVEVRLPLLTETMDEHTANSTPAGG